MDIAPDGSPVQLYRRLPERTDEAALVHDLLARPGSVLDIGCGTGRLSEPLARLGHRVTGVDNEPAMLAALTATRPVLADATTLELGDRFDAVLLMSHVVNTADEVLVAAVLRAVSRHLRQDGFALLERYPPGWVATCTETSRTVADVRLTLRDLQREGEVLTATMRYDFDGQRAEQRFSARDVDDERVSTLAATVGLRFVSTINDAGTLLLLRPH